MRPTFLIALAALGLSACQCSNGTNQPPDVVIGSPRNGEVLRGRGPFQLQGQVTDPEELIPPTSIVWTSDRGGTLGFGSAVLANLSPGAHRLRLTATDSEGVSSSAEISVTVADDSMTTNTPPTAHIDAPADGEFFDEGAPITFEGRGTDAEDGTLTGAALVWTSSLDGALGTGAQLTVNDATLGRHRLVLTVTDSRGESAVDTVEFEVVPPGTNRPPNVTIASPMNGAVLTLGTPATLTGSATDAEDGPLTGASLAWSSSRDGALGTGASITATLTQGVHVLTLTATDSMNASSTAQVTVSVNQANNQAPVVTITAPMNNSTVFAGSTVTFTGGANDPEDGALSGMSLAWSSSRDGALGTGASLPVTTLTAGAHVITLVATDSGGNTGTATLNLTVLPMNAAPTVSISMPADNTTIAAGTNVTFTAVANDAEDGALNGAAVRWNSSLAGALGNGVSISSASLMQGTHLITVTATDSGGRSASASINLVVTPGATNLPPIARITGAMSGQATQSLTFDGSTSSDPDGTIAAWRFEFSDGTPAVTGMNTVQHVFATPGSYTVTLTVTDDDGATSSATHTVTVTPFVRVPVIATPDVSDAAYGCGLVARGSSLHVAWLTSRHPTLWYGTWSNGALTGEVVDALGFNVGGLVGQVVALEVSASGVPFIAYYRDEQLWLASKPGASWVRERADSAAQPAQNGYGISLALETSGRVALAYTTGSGNQRAVIAVRTNGSWTQNVLPLPGTGTLYNSQPLGGLAFQSNGAFLMPVTYSSSSTGGNYVSNLASWNGTATELLPLTGLSGATSLMPVTASRVFVLGSNGLLDIALGSPLSTSTMQRSALETSNTSRHVVAATTTGAPRIVINHSSSLEFVWPSTTPGFWERMSLGAVDSGGIDADVDGNGDTRACFLRAGKLMIY